MANMAARSNPGGPVISILNPPRNGSANIHAFRGVLVCAPPATTAASMRSHRGPGTPLMRKTVSHCRAITVTPEASRRQEIPGFQTIPASRTDQNVHFQAVCLEEKTKSKVSRGQSKRGVSDNCRLLVI